LAAKVVAGTARGCLPSSTSTSTVDRYDSETLHRLLKVSALYYHLNVSNESQSKMQKDFLAESF
jgi:hypothetical protein